MPLELKENFSFDLFRNLSKNAVIKINNILHGETSGLYEGWDRTCNEVNFQQSIG